MSTNLEELGSIAKNIKYRQRTCADLILDYLADIGVEYVFGVPGGAIEPFYNALARRARGGLERPVRPPLHKMLARKTHRGSQRLRPIVARHEAGAAFMADGYARETGKLGVCCATTGPGTSNLLTGVASAYAERTPMLVITAQTALPGFGNQGFQDSSSDAIDTVGMFEHCTRYNSLVSHPEQLERKLLSALASAYRNPRGPAHLSIPMDVQNHPANSSGTPFDIATLFRQPEVVDLRSFDAVSQALVDARKVVVFIGNDCKGPIDRIVQFAELIGACIVTSPSGKGLINAFHPLYRGVFGFAGHKSAADTLLDADVDLILAVGSSFDELSTSGCNTSVLLNEKLIHVDATMDNFIRSPMARLHVYGHMDAIFTDLIQILKNHKQLERNGLVDGGAHSGRSASIKLFPSMGVPRGNSTFGAPKTLTLRDAEKYLSNEIPLKPQRLMYELAKRFPDNTRFLPDTGNSWAWATHYLHLKNPGNYRVGMGFGAMTWAIGAAVGTALGGPAPVVCITGDGSFLMSGQELTVAVQQRLPVVFVVLNDQALGMVKHGQRLGDAEPIGFELPPVDFAAVARAMGAQAYTIRRPEDFEDLDILAICNAEHPTLLDVYIDPEEVPPMQARIKILESAKAADK